MVRKDGKYYYAPHRRKWGVWKHHNNGNGGGYGEFIADFNTKIQAKDFAFKMNGYTLN